MKTLIVVGVDPGSKKNEQGEPVGAWAALRVPYRRPARYISHGTGTAKQIIEAVQAIPDVDMVAVEQAAHLHPKSSPGALYSVAKNLLETTKMATAVSMTLALQHYKVVEATANEWRRAVVGTPSPSDALVLSAVRMRVLDWPPMADEHHADAAGCALAMAWKGI